LRWAESSKPVGEASTSKEGAAVKLVNKIILAAIDREASDIHIEPLKDRLRIRFRQDGVLMPFEELSKDVTAALTNRIKVLCDVDITEKRRHQGGRILFGYHGGELDLRVSFYVTVHGEKIVMRLLNRKGLLLKIQHIGMARPMLERFKEDALYQPSGVILITGPTGSGKTTTVYSCIHTINTPQVSIITAEEPVEYVIDGISQCSINPKINLTFEETLRHIVRQDPDVIVIGEIRDNFSAEVAVQAALTGHKVLTTFHTEDSIGGLIRLLKMNIEAFLISSTVVSVLAQRLVRKVCPECSKTYKPSTAELQRLGYTANDVVGTSFRKGDGCAHCQHTGYKGRVGIFELLVLDESVRNAIIDQKTSQEIRRISIESTGLVTLIEDGIFKAASGLTTIDEVLRCLPRLQKPRPFSELKRLLGE
jgi:type IV pilus assembly protein PilB